MKTILLFVMVVFYLLSSQIPKSSNKNSSARPNILFILTDDQRWDMMGCAGNKIISTPHIDKIAEKGIRFTHVFATTPICAASRASILTGLYERTHDFTFKKPPVQKKFTDISYPYLLKKAGYSTGIVGKFGVKLETPIDSMFTYEQINGFPYWKNKDGEVKYLTDIQGDQAIQFIRQSVHKDPFCLSISFSAPHADDDSKEQYFWPPSLDTLYSSVKMPIPSTARKEFYDSLPDFLKGTMSRERWHWRFDSPEKFQSMVKGYYRMITALDQTIGRIMDELKTQGIADNTIIIFMGDNGYYLGDRGYADKWLMHDVSLRIPLLIYDPRIKYGKKKTIDEMVLNVDVAPTILSLAGLPIPDKMQGKNLIPLMKNKATSWPQSIFCEHLMDEPKIPNSECIRTNEWKFIRYPTHPEYVELYNLQKDPTEEHNLAFDKTYEKKINQFQAECDTRIKKLLADR